MEISSQPVAQVMLELGEAADAGQARRTIGRYAEDLHMAETDRGALAIAVTELATNIIKHAGRGRMICEAIGNNGVRGVRVLSVDEGPGIRDVSAALRDGYSTAGTSGSGLGAVQRLATSFDLYSAPDRGTCVMAEFWPHKKHPANGFLQLGVVSVPIQGEEVCGDGWNVKATADRTYVMVVDGLGHGLYAAEAAREAERVVADAQSGTPSSLLQDCHDALKKTRGAAAAIAAIDPTKRTLTFCGVGNISAVVFSRHGRRGLASHNGTVGHNFHRAQEFTLPWDQDSVLVMHSDGLSTRWDLERYPGVIKKHPSLMAAVLYRDFAKHRDDATVLVAKNS